tara:strand:+ start:528 stop:1022 length:495 start_codon:yes stop_codon:yes gene_type:complete
LTFSLDVLNEVMRMDYPRHKIVHWQPAHLYICDLNEFDKQNMELFEGYQDYLQAYADGGHAYTAIGEGEIYAMFGLFKLWPGVGEAWLIPSNKIDRKTLAMHRAALRFFEYAANELQIKRLQFTVHTLNERADRWAQRCYFEREGLLKKYGPDGSDYWMYARMF